MDARTSLKRARTLLFVPADRPERFPKALESGADFVVLDLEDAVPESGKADARDCVDRWLSAIDATCLVRVNARDTESHEADLRMLSRHHAAVMVPKCESARQLEAVIDELGPEKPVLALVETADGILAAREIAAVGGVDRLAFGNYDLAAQLGMSPDDHLALASLRMALVLASASCGLPPPIDGVTGAVADGEALLRDMVEAKRLGFGGKLCIHPGQVLPVTEALRPSKAELDWAGRVLDAAAAAGGGAAVLDGRMIDRPVVERAHRICEAGLVS